MSERDVVRDPARLEAVRATGLLDTGSEEVFDRLTRLASRIVGAPVSFISLVDEERDFYKSFHGSGEPLASARELSGPTFCHYTIRSAEPLVIPDTRADSRYCHVPTVESLGVAAYLGVPLVTSAGQPIGSFCAIDFQPREWTDEDVQTVRELAASAMREIELRREVSERRRMEQEVRRSEELLRRLLDSEQEARAEAERHAVEEAALRRAAAAVTATFTVEEASRRIAESALEATRAEGAFVERIDAETWEIVVAALAGEQTPRLGTRMSYAGSLTERAVERQEPQLVEHVHQASPALYPELGTLCMDCSVLVVPLLDAGEPIGTLVLVRRADEGAFRPEEVARARTFGDLAALAFRKVHLLEDSEKRREELERVTESRARLIRGFSHDLKNPLGAADGHAQLLQDGILGALGEPQQRSVGRIRSSIRSALELIEDLVELARAEAGQLEMELRPTDVREVARELVEDYRPQVEGAGLRLTAELPESFPVVRSDPTRVRQVLGNLISNAIKYNRPDGEISLRASLRPCAALRRKCMAVEVADTGIGIPAEKRDLLFREFSRLSPERVEGAGLGLAISHRIAGALGGTITVESEPGRGSTFILWLPAEEGSADGGPARSGAP